MNKGEKYDEMVKSPADDPLKCFENYFGLMEYMQKHMIEFKPVRIFDLGCGTGNLTGDLSELYSVFGIDQSEEMLKRFKKKHPYTKCLHADGIQWLETFDFKKGDVLTSSFFIHSITDKDRLFHGLLKALKEGARVLLLDYCFESENDKGLYTQLLLDDNRSDLVDFILGKHYLYIDTLKEWCATYAVSARIQKHTHWIYSIDLQANSSF